jgi:hypothetical protein
VVVIARRAAVKASFEALRGEWLYLAKRAGVLVPSETERDPHA